MNYAGMIRELLQLLRKWWGNASAKGVKHTVQQREVCGVNARIPNKWLAINIFLE
jgi:hypothetical protein